MWRKMAKSVRANILVGLVLVTPLAITLWIVNFLFKYLTNYIVPKEWLQAEHSDIYRMLALVLVFAGLYLIGLLTRNFIGKRLYHFGESILTRIPVIKTIYVAIRQVSESVFNSRRTLFKQVVAIEFPRKGLYSLGFVTSPVSSDFAARLSVGGGGWTDAVCLLVPTAPNPTTGFFMMVPRTEVIMLDISVPDAMKMIISAGTVLPGRTSETGKTLLDRLDEWLRTESDLPDEQ